MENNNNNNNKVREVITDLMDTVPYMNSDDYKDRFFAEYIQLKIRIEKLESFIIKIRSAYYSDSKENFQYSSLVLLEEQSETMQEYMKLLKIRAKIEDINL